MIELKLMRADAELLQMVLEDFLEYLKSESTSDKAAIKQTTNLLHAVEEALEKKP